MSNRNLGLDSLRGFAITLVVMSHSGILAQGGLANAIFFSVSGFLAMLPFAEEGEKRFTRPIYIGKYYLNRFIRVFPIMWVCIIGVWLLFPYDFFSGSDMRTFNSLILNLVLVKAKHHLWFLQQEVVFYFVLPFIMLIIFFSKKAIRYIYDNSVAHNIIIAVIVIVLAFLYHEYCGVNVFYLWGNGIKQYFRLDQFLIGMGFGYIYKAIVLNKGKLQKSKSYRFVGNLYGTFFLGFCIFSSKFILAKWNEAYAEFLVGWEMPMLCSILTGCFILILLTEKKVCFVRYLGINCYPMWEE